MLKAFDRTSDSQDMGNVSVVTLVQVVRVVGLLRKVSACTISWDVTTAYLGLPAAGHLGSRAPFSPPLPGYSTEAGSFLGSPSLF